MTSPTMPFPSFQGEDPAATVERWNRYVASVEAALQQSAGFEREKLTQQYADAQKGRDNAVAIARLSAETSRYGVDVGRQNTLDGLRQRQQEFEATHALDQQRVGLDYAKTATDYLSTPDHYFEGANYINMAGRALGRTTNGPQAAGPYGQGMTPTPKTEQDFAVLAGYTQPGAGGGGTAVSGGSAARPDIVTAAGGGNDQRVKALKAMIDAVPPSGGLGLDGNDYAVIQAAKALYSTNLNPTAWQSLKRSPGALDINRSAGRRLGYNTAAWEAQQTRQGIGQGSVRGY